MPRRRGKDSGSSDRRRSSGTQLEQAPDATAHSRERTPKSKRAKRQQMSAEAENLERAPRPLESEEPARER